MKSQAPFIRALVVTILLATCSSAKAQVNTEPLRKRIKNKGFSFVLQGSFDGHTGNTQGVTASGMVGVGFSVRKHLAFGFASEDYSKLNGTLGVDQSFAHGRYNYELDTRVWWEGFLQAQSDSFQRIKIRTLLGTGPRVALFDDSRLGLFLGVAYMLERDVINVLPGANEERNSLFSRASGYLTAHATLDDGVDAVTTTYVQPRIDDPSDIRIHSESGFIFKMGKRFSVSVTFTAHYDSNPPVGVLPTDTEVKNTIALTL